MLLTLSCWLQTESSQAKVRMMLALKDVGIREDKKKNGLSLSESALAALEGLVSLCCGEPRPGGLGEGAAAGRASCWPSVSPEEISSCPAILVCGPQDVGKSTFNRYLINQLLNRCSMPSQASTVGIAEGLGCWSARD